MGLTLALALSGCPAEEPFPNFAELDQLKGMWRQLTPQPPPTNAFRKNPQAAALGKKLFFDPGLSDCGTIACSTCHVPPSYAADTPLSTGCHGVTGRNTPTLLNAEFREWFYWDGRKDSLWSHAILPVTRDIEMNATAESIRAHLQAKYADEYAVIFGKQPGSESDGDRILANFGKLIDAFLNTLVRVQSPFDDQLKSYTDKAEAGEDVSKEPLHLALKTYIRKGKCIACHQGPGLSDDRFHNIGVDDKGAADPGRLAGVDLVLNDRFNAAGVYSDDRASGRVKMEALAAASRDEMLGAFKTPTLRNIALTAPYMHTGEYKTLEDVIDFYDRGGDPEGTFLGKKTETIGKLNLTPAEKKALVDMLNMLTGTENP